MSACNYLSVFPSACAFVCLCFSVANSLRHHLCVMDCWSNRYYTDRYVMLSRTIMIDLLTVLVFVSFVLVYLLNFINQRVKQSINKTINISVYLCIYISVYLCIYVSTIYDYLSIFLQNNQSVIIITFFFFGEANIPFDTDTQGIYKKAMQWLRHIKLCSIFKKEISSSNSLHNIT